MKRQVTLTAVLVILAFAAGYQLGENKLLFRSKIITTRSEALTENTPSVKLKEALETPTPKAELPNEALPPASFASTDTNEDIPNLSEEQLHTYLQNLDENPVLDRGAVSTIIPGEVRSKTENESGETITEEVLPDGSTAHRQYGKDGRIEGESIELPGGKNLTRNFFETGKVKTLFVQNEDKSKISMLFDSSGSPTQRVLETEEGIKLYTEYDDHGQIKHVYQILPNGDSSLLR